MFAPWGFTLAKGGARGAYNEDLPLFRSTVLGIVRWYAIPLHSLCKEVDGALGAVDTVEDEEDVPCPKDRADRALCLQQGGIFQKEEVYPSFGQPF